MDSIHIVGELYKTLQIEIESFSMNNNRIYIMTPDVSLSNIETISNKILNKIKESFPSATIEQIDIILKKIQLNIKLY